MTFLNANLGPEQLKDCRVTVVGLGRFGGGISAVRYLAAQGAIVSLTDRCSENELKHSLAEISDVSLRQTFFGGHPDEAFRECDVVVINPAVRPHDDLFLKLSDLKIPITTEIQLLLSHLQNRDLLTPNPAANQGSNSATPSDAQKIRLVGVTGTNGKSTTSALIYHLLKTSFTSDQSDSESQTPQVWLGGNIGNSLLPVVDEIRPGDIVVLELSSFQLHYLKGLSFSPDIAVLTSFTANHLDWHQDLSDYRASKQVLFARQRRDQVAIIPADHLIEGQHPVSLSDEDDLPIWRLRTQSFRFGIEDEGLDGVYFDEDALIVRFNGIEDAVRVSLPDSLKGVHNQSNMSAAVCAAVQAGANLHSIQRQLVRFQGLPFRMQQIAMHAGVKFINDSSSTTPESTFAAVRTFSDRIVSSRGTAFDSRLVVIVGGHDKGSDYRALVDCLCQFADAVVLIGAIAGTLSDLLALANPKALESVVAKDMKSAFTAAVELAGSSGIVLLSPGCSSLGWFRDYVDRGQQFNVLVEQWTQR